MKPVNFAVTAYLLGLASVAHAEELYLGGSEFSRDSSYVYMGRMASLDKDGLQDGAAYRLWADRAQYQYNSGSISHEGVAYGLEIGLGRLVTLSDSLNGSFFVSGVLRNVELRPDDPASDNSGTKMTIKFQFDLGFRISDEINSTITSVYELNNNTHWSRLRTMKRVGHGYQLGVDFVRAGDDDYDLWQAGLVFGGARLGGADLKLKGGAQKTRGEETIPYFGIELGGLF